MLWRDWSRLGLRGPGARLGPRRSLLPHPMRGLLSIGPQAERVAGHARRSGNSCRKTPPMAPPNLTVQRSMIDERQDLAGHPLSENRRTGPGRVSPPHSQQGWQRMRHLRLTQTGRTLVVPLVGLVPVLHAGRTPTACYLTIRLPQVHSVRYQDSGASRARRVTPGRRILVEIPGVDAAGSRLVF